MLPFFLQASKVEEMVNKFQREIEKAEEERRKSSAPVYRSASRSSLMSTSCYEDSSGFATDSCTGKQPRFHKSMGNLFIQQPVAEGGRTSQQSPVKHVSGKEVGQDFYGHFLHIQNAVLWLKVLHQMVFMRHLF